MELPELLKYFEAVKKRSEGDYMVRCPTHDDHNPSLHITDVGDRILIYDFGGCEAKDILDKLGLTFKDLIK